MASFRAIFQRPPDPFVRSDNKKLPSLHKLNDSVYEFHSPPDGVSMSLEIVFFHGVERGDSRNAYVETWTSFLESTVVCWPQTLLAEQFRGARILSVSYDSSIEKGPRQGNLDLYLTAENLVQDLIDDAKVAANPGLPVILIGKDFGGLVIKAICMKAEAQKRINFLSNLKAIFYYGTPHLGVENLPTAFNGALAERLMFGNNEIARLGSDFNKHRKEWKWETRAVLSLHTSKKVPELIISEASQRNGVDKCYTPNEDIDTVCKSQTKNSSSFKFLTCLISRVERGKCMLESSPDQGLTQKGVGFITSLGFGHDENYVPMEKTLAEAKNAIQGARIVVVHGGPGSGKSSLSKYLALQFEAGARQQGVGVAASSSAEQSDWLPNGVVYITCGNGAEIISLQRELLRKFGMEVSLQQDMSTASEGPAQLRKRLRQELVEHLSKLESRVLVILDDVWDSPDLLDNLLVPGDRVRYLLTTQISTLWNSRDSKRVQMQDVTLEDARHILGNYANFRGGVISKNLEDLGDEIIITTGSHPLALATLGIVLYNMKGTRKDWQEVKDNLKEHLETKDYSPSCFGHKYPLSVDASMMVGLDLLDEDAKKLLYKIALFDGPLILETLLQLFLACTLPKGKKINTSKSKMSLVAKGLVRIETEKFEERVSNTTFSSVGDDMSVIWIHSLRQHFILTTKTEEICQITNFLENDYDQKFVHLEHRSNLDLAIALCALYGATDIKRRAQVKMGSHFMETHSQLASALKPFVSLMLSEGDTKGPISQAAVEVFLRYVWKRQLDDEKISYLLRLTTYPSAPWATLRALEEIFYIEYYSIEEVKLIHEDHLGFVSVVLSLLYSRENAHVRIHEKTVSETPQIQLRACRALDLICAKARKEKSTAIVLNVPHVLTVLVDIIEAELQAEPAKQSNQLAAKAVGILLDLSYGDSNDLRLKICNTEGLLACLVRSLSAHYNHPLQKWAAAVLGNLGGDYADTKWIICNAQGALAGLIKSLSARDNHRLQEHAARALQNLASGNVGIKLKICNEEGVLSALVRSLSDLDNHRLQEHAAAVLANLPGGDADIMLKICNEKGALSGLVRSLTEYNNPPLQAHAARALQNLASGNVDIKIKICNEEGALSRLVWSLSAHYNHRLQKHAAIALRNLACGDVGTKFKICNEKGALSALVRSLSEHDNLPLQEHAAKVLHYLACGDVDIKLKICNEEGALTGLVRSLSEHSNPLLQKHAAKGLQNLAVGMAPARKVCDEPGLLAALVQSLSAHQNPALQIATAFTLANLALEGGDFKLKIFHEERALSGLVKLLFQEENTDVQEAAALALLDVAFQDETVQLKVANEKGAIEGLLRAMSQHDKPVLQVKAMSALYQIAMVAADLIKLKITEEEGAVARLVKLSKDVNPELREPAKGLVVTMGLEGSTRSWMQYFLWCFGW